MPEVIDQQAGTKRQIDSLSLAISIMAFSGVGKPYVALIYPSANPIEYNGEEVTFNPSIMVTDAPYPFRFLGHTMLVVKGKDETLTFYYLPPEPAP